MSSIINTFDGDERGRIKHHAAYGNMAALLRVAGFDARMSMEEQFADEGIETPADMVAHYDDAGGFREVSGVGPKGDQKSAAVVELIRTAIVDDDDTPAPSHQATFGSGELELEDTTETDLTAYGVDPDDRKEREPRQDVATSETFGVDDRELRATTDGGEQVTLGDGPDVEPEEGQATLVDVATEDTDEDDDQDDEDDQSREAALDLLADGSWHLDLIAPAFDVTPQVASSIYENADRAGDVIRWHANTDGDLTMLPHIGEKSAASISRTIPKLKSRGVTQHQGDLARYDGEVDRSEPEPDQDDDQDDTDDDQDDSDDRRSYSGIGGGRRRKLDAIEAKDRLEPIDDPETLDELVDAIEDLSLDGVRNPPERVIEKVESVHDSLPEEAQAEYVSDAKMVRTVNAARRYWSKTYLPRMKRESEMPGPYEAGPSKYPHKKLNKRQDSYRKATNELGEKIDRIRSRAGGAKQRALNAIGSSVAEQTEKKEAEQRETLREILEPGQVIQYRNPSLEVGVIKRVNQKSVRIMKPNPRAGKTKRMSDEPEPEFRKTTQDLDPQWLTLIDRESYPDEIETVREYHEEIPADYDEAVEYLSGGEVSAPEPQE